MGVGYLHLSSFALSTCPAVIVSASACQYEAIYARMTSFRYATYWMGAYRRSRSEFQSYSSALCIVTSLAVHIDIASEAIPEIDSNYSNFDARLLDSAGKWFPSLSHPRLYISRPHKVLFKFT
jgi:hypothetical protein